VSRISTVRNKAIGHLLYPYSSCSSFCVHIHPSTLSPLPPVSFTSPPFFTPQCCRAVPLALCTFSGCCVLPLVARTRCRSTSCLYLLLLLFCEKAAYIFSPHTRRHYHDVSPHHAAPSAAAPLTLPSPSSPSPVRTPPRRPH
jgi:hypothetical protein